MRTDKDRRTGVNQSKCRRQSTVAGLWLPGRMSEILNFDPLKNPVLVYLSSLSPATRVVIRSDLNTIAKKYLHIELFVDAQGRPVEPGQGQDISALAVEWHNLDYATLARIREQIRADYAPATVNLVLSAIRGVLRTAFQLELMDADRYQRLLTVKAVYNKTIRKGVALTNDDLSKIFNVCLENGGAKAVRDAAIIALMVGGGLRRVEIVRMNTGDFDDDTNTIIVRGKRNKQRKIFLSDSTKRYLREWIAVRENILGVGINVSAPMFCPVRKNGAIDRKLRRLSAQAINNIVREWSLKSGIEFHPHDLRRTFITHLLDAGHDISLVRKLAGHANVQTTARYDMRDEPEMRAAVAVMEW